MGIETIGRGSQSLLGLLDITSQGIGPDKLGNIVQPSIECFSFLGEQSFRTAAGTQTIAAGGGDFPTISCKVTDGMIWVVRGVCLIVQFDPSGASGITATGRIQIEDWSPATGYTGGIGGGPPMDIFPTNSSPWIYSGTSTTNVYFGFTWEPHQPLVMRSGQTGQYIRAYVQSSKTSNTAGSATLTVYLHEMQA